MKLACLLLLSTTAFAFDIDAALRREGERKQTFGPTGRRLFTERLAPGHGLRGHFCYVHHSELRDPLVLEGLAPGEVTTVWYPSHLQVESAAGELTVSEAKFITDDDVLVDVIQLTNGGAVPVTVPLTLTSGFATQPRNGGAEYLPSDLSALANTNPAPAGNLLGGDEPRYWYYEAETPLEQRGSTAEDRKQAASGGRVLGMDFGSAADHFAEYEVETPALTGAVLYLRVARAASPGAEGPSPWRVRLDGDEVGTFEVAVTGGWGDAAGEFAWHRLDLPALAAGRHRLRLESTRAGNNVNVDGFLLGRGPLSPPEPGEDGRIPPTGFEQLHYRPGRQVIGGVPFELLDPAANGGRGVVALRGGELAAPATVPGDRLHLLYTTAGERAEPTPLRVTLSFAGAPERTELVPATDQPWSVATLDLPGEAELDQVRLEAGEGTSVPVVLAVTVERFGPNGTLPELRGEAVFHGVRGAGVAVAPGFAAGDGGSLTRRVTVPPGGAERVVLALGVAEDELEAERRAVAWAATPDPLAAHRGQYQAWYDDNCPTFESSDPMMDRLWAYRWFVARHCLSRAGAGKLAEPCFFEGMHGGWYPSQIDYSSPHIIDEVRWLRDPAYAYGQGLNHAANPGPDGIFESLRTNWQGGWYTHWIDASLWGAYQVHPDRAMLTRLVDAMAADVRGHFVRFDRDGDRLCTPPSHWPTGMEWQPAFFYFVGYDNTQPEAALERGDLVAYVYANAQAVSAAYRELGRAAEAAEFETIAAEVRAACLDKMWFPDEHWFYALEESSDLPALCMEIVGLYPFAFGLPPDGGEYAESLRYLFDEAYFWNPYPAATVAKSCPVYTPAQQEWPGPGGRTTGCMWNGPTWPHANSLVANAIANALRDYATNRHATPERYWDFFERWTRLHFESGELDRPNIQEYYHGETGVGWGCDDYFHSTWCDLVIRHVAGLRPSAGERLVLDPIPGPLTHFRLDRLRYHGRELTVEWNGDGTYAGAREFRVQVNGVTAARRDDLGHLEIRLDRPR